MTAEYRPDPYSEEGDIFFATHCADCLRLNEHCTCTGGDSTSDILPPFHTPMHSIGQCDFANDRIAVLEMDQEALKAENERLKCCENCGVGADCEDWISGDVGPSCTPSRWMEGSTL